MASIRLDVPFILMMMMICTVVSTKKCTNPLPALMQMASGVDITTYDPFSDLGDPNLNHGLVENVFNFTCSTKIRPGWGNYDQPDPLSIIEFNANFYDEVSFMFDITSAKKTLMARLGLEYDSESSLGAFSRNPMYTSLLKQHFSSNKVFSQNEIKLSALNPSIESKLSHLSHDFTKFISDKLPLKYEDDPSVYQTFVQRFGTHYFEQALISVSTYSQFALNRDYVFDSSNEKIGTNIRVAFYDYFKNWDMAGRINDFKLVDRKEFANVSEIILAFSNTQMNYSRWVDKLTGTLYIPMKLDVMSIRLAVLQPIEQLIENETKRTQVAIAVRIYRIRAQLEELKNIYKFSSDYYQMSDEEKASFEKVNKLINMHDIKQIDQMVKIINELYGKSLMARDKAFNGPVIDDLYVIASSKLEFAKQICAFSIGKLVRGQITPQCPAYDIVNGQSKVSNLYEDYHRLQNYSWNSMNTDNNYDLQNLYSILKRARSLNLEYSLRDEIKSGLKASCDVCF